MTKANAPTSTPDDTVGAALKSFEDAGFGSLAWMSSAYAQAWSDLGHEVIDFVTDRIKEDVATQQKILACRSIFDLQQTQAAFLAKATAQYTAETGKMIELGAKLMPGAVQEVPKS